MPPGEPPFEPADPLLEERKGCTVLPLDPGLPPEMPLLPEEPCVGLAPPLPAFPNSHHKHS